MKINSSVQLKLQPHRIGIGLCEVVNVVCQVQACSHKMCTVHAQQGSKSVYYYSVVNGLDNSSNRNRCSCILDRCS